MSDTLPSFPTDDMTLSALEHALTSSYTVTDLLDFLAGCVGEDPNEEWIDAGIVYDTRIHYHEHDVIRALITEIRRLRGEDDQVGANFRWPQ